MSFEQLKNYVITQRLAGVSDEQITTSLTEKHWHPELIEKALNEGTTPPGPTPSETELSTRLLSVQELISASWHTLIADLRSYILCTLATMFAPLAVLIIFLAPIVYDVVALHFTVNDFLSKSLIPVVALHLTLGILTLIIVSLWGALALYTLVAHNGKLTLRQTFKRAWERLPGFTLVGILSGFITLLGLIVFIIPGLIFSVYFSFASLSYVVHGARGKSALLSSVALVHGRWWKTFWRIIAPSLLTVLATMILNTILPGLGGFLARIFITPFVVIYSFLLYQNYVAFNKAHPKEESTDVKDITNEVASIDK